MTNGLDMAKLRLQVQRGAVAAGRWGEIAGQSGGGGGFQYSSFLDAMRGIVRREVRVENERGRAAVGNVCMRVAQ